jgi:hypothetical protein
MGAQRVGRAERRFCATRGRRGLEENRAQMTSSAHSRFRDRPLRDMTVRSNDDDPVGGELLVVGQDSKSFECDVEVGLGGPACGRVLRQGADQGECLCRRDVATGPAFALGPIP